MSSSNLSAKPTNTAAFSNNVFVSSQSTLAHLETRPELREMFMRSAGVREGYSTREHTEMVLNQFASYPFAEALQKRAAAVSAPAFRMLLALHDLDKVPEEGSTADLMKKHQQHGRTSAVMDRFRDLLPISDAEHRIMKSLVSADIFGSFFKGLLPVQVPGALRHEHGKLLRESWSRHSYRKACDSFLSYAIQSEINPQARGELLDIAACKIQRAAKASGLPAMEYLYLATVYYQCDTTAYTSDAYSGQQRGILSLDFMYQRNTRAKHPDQALFKFCDDAGRLKFREPFEGLYQDLSTTIRALVRLP